MILSSLRRLATAAMLCVALPAAGRAADLPPVPDTSDWTFTVALYGWASGLNGEVGMFGLPPREVDLPFSDVIKDLDFAAMGMAVARNGRFSLGVDATYTNVGSTVSVNSPLGVLARKIDATNTSLMITGFGGYALYDTEAARLEIIAGGRVWSVNNEFNLKDGILADRSFSENATWVDPLVGARLRVDILPEVYVSGWAMIGGFGAGSELMWDLMGGAGYRFNDYFSLFAAYRANSVDYSNDGFVYDVVQQGPALALVFDF